MLTLVQMQGNSGDGRCHECGKSTGNIDSEGYYICHVCAQTSGCLLNCVGGEHDDDCPDSPYFVPAFRFINRR